jgi:cell wall-associated NlpC family hydrolase
MTEKLRQVVKPVLPIWRDSTCDRQERELLFGERFTVQSETGGFGYGYAEKDGYCGFVDVSGLGEPSDATHMVSSFGSHIYPMADIKSASPVGLSFGSRLKVTGSSGTFLQIDEGGYVPAGHVRPLTNRMEDPAAVAEMFLGAPYLWGGNSCWGIDCSGLVQATLMACGIDCPADSGEQRGVVGVPFGDNVAVERGDLFFWNSHVAMALDEKNLIHATAFHMAVVVEDIQEVIGRIADMGEGLVLARRRP